jgi:hypothetical protein
MYPNESFIYNFLKSVGQPLTTQQIAAGILPKQDANLEDLLQGMQAAGFISQTFSAAGEALWLVAA